MLLRHKIAKANIEFAKLCYTSNYNNHGHNIVGKFTKLSKVGVSLEFLTTDVLQFSRTAVEV